MPPAPLPLAMEIPVAPPTLPCALASSALATTAGASTLLPSEQCVLFAPTAVSPNCGHWISPGPSSPLPIRNHALDARISLYPSSRSTADECWSSRSEVPPLHELGFNQGQRDMDLVDSSRLSSYEGIYVLGLIIGVLALPYSSVPAHRHNNLPSPPREFGCVIIYYISVRPKNICRLLNRQPQLPHRALTEKHPDASSADGEDDPLHFSVTLQHLSFTVHVNLRVENEELFPRLALSILVGMFGLSVDLLSLVKILKKYDKRTGALIRQPFIEKVLQQPFFTTDLLYKLVKECMAMLDHLFPSNNLSISAECDGQNGVPKPTQSGGRVPKLEEITYMHSLYMKSTVAALQSMKQIRSKSSTIVQV
ncbi:hypothetical protein ZIOFF_043544 [Zingiber officinale]|uniref:Uncharacterized protein n=1 Tax=Zingiber officinale TaxID=94328 RepID=A0A8J5G3Q4_ZINOF|nr:hypothetical protein ZIOFF_043544 [Zingiber officinale]